MEAQAGRIGEGSSANSDIKIERETKPKRSRIGGNVREFESKATSGNHSLPTGASGNIQKRSQPSSQRVPMWQKDPNDPNLSPKDRQIIEKAIKSRDYRMKKKTKTEELAHENSSLKDEVRELCDERASLRNQIEELERENARLTTQKEFCFILEDALPFDCLDVVENIVLEPEEFDYM